MEMLDLIQKNVEYELLSIDWQLEYDFDSPKHLSCVHDGGDEENNPHQDNTVIDYDEKGIPMGEEPQDEKLRRQIIHKFLQNWRASHPEAYVVNKELNEPIKIIQVSLREACKHSARSYKSTQAVLLLEAIIADAKKIGESRIKPGDNSQKNYEKMIVMSYRKEGLGIVKLTIGVRKRTHEKVEYGITVPHEGIPFIDPELKIQDKSKKKKTSHRKR